MHAYETVLGNCFANIAIDELRIVASMKPMNSLLTSYEIHSGSELYSSWDL